MTETHYAQDALLYKKNKLRKKLKQKKKRFGMCQENVRTEILTHNLHN